MQLVLHSIQLEGYPTAHAEFLIDDHSFEQFDVPGNTPPIEPLLVANLAATGVNEVAHRFTVKQVDGAFFFESVTVWHNPAPAVEASP